MSTMLTPEIIEAIAKNAAGLKAAMTSGDEMAAIGGGHNGNDEECCSPKLLKFKFILCDVKINNVNAVAAEEDNHSPKPHKK